MKKLLAMLLFALSFAAHAGGASLYDITPTTSIKDVERKLGKPSARIPFGDGSTAYVFQLPGHNVIVETGAASAGKILAVQVAGENNPEGKGLFGIDLGDKIAAVEAKFGKPMEKRPSLDEQTNQAIPNAFIHQYKSFSFEETNGKVSSMKLHLE